MAITIDLGYTPSTTTKNLPIYDESFSNWGLVEEKTSSGPTRRHDILYSDSTGPADRRATLKVFCETLPDVYDKSGINPIYQSPIKTGVRIGWTFRNTIKISDSDNPGHPIYVPEFTTITHGFGLNPNIGVTEMFTALKEALAQAFPTGTITTNQLAMWLAGSIQTQLDESST